MIFFAGALLDDTAASPPAVIRGYDTAGNLLSVIRADYPDGAVHSLTSGAIDTWTTPGFTVRGVPATQVRYGQSMPDAWRPQCVAVDSKGRILCGTGPTSGYFLSVGDGVNRFGVTDFFRVYRRAGDRVRFPQLHGGEIRAVAVAGNDDIIVGGFEVGAERHNLRRYSAEGNLIWSAGGAALSSDLQIVDQIEIAPDGSIYAAGKAPWAVSGNDVWAYWAYGWVCKYSEAGALQWARVFDCQLGTSNPITSMHVSGSGALFIGAAASQHRAPPGAGHAIGDYTTTTDRAYCIDSSANAAVTKWSAEGVFLGAWAPAGAGTDAPRCTVKVHSGVVYATAPSDWYGVAHDYWELSAIDLSETVSGILGHQCVEGGQSVAIDPVSGVRYFGQRHRITPGAEVYFGHFNTASPTETPAWGGLSATSAGGVTSDGVALTSAEYLALTYTTPYGAVAGPDRGFTGATNRFGDFWSPAVVCFRGGLPLPAAPAWLRAGLPAWEGDRYVAVPGSQIALRAGSAVVFREYSGPLRLPDVYLLSISGDPPISIQISSVSIRRSAAGASLNVVCPAIAGDLVEEIFARVGEAEMTLLRGVRFLGGESQLDVVLTTPVGAARWDGGPSSASLTLSGESAGKVVAPRTRLLSGVSYKAAQNGRRRWRCAVDQYLRPGDYAALSDGETLTVAEITVQVSPSGAMMEVAE